MLLGFKKVFAPKVQAGLRGEPDGKRQSIRARRKIKPKVGETVYLYTGLRTKDARKLGEGVVTSVDDIRIDMYTNEGGTISEDISLPGQGRYLTDSEAFEMAKADGFATAREFVVWFKTTHGLPFNGWLIKWAPKGEGQAVVISNLPA